MRGLPWKRGDSAVIRHRRGVLLHSRPMTLPPVTNNTTDNPAPGLRRRWRGRPRGDATPAGDWPELVGRLLSLRGVTDGAGAAAFLGAPDGPPDPSALPALDVAIERLLQAVQQHETVAVYGDFDVDGVTSAAQLAEALSSLGAVPLIYIPDQKH